MTLDTIAQVRRRYRYRGESQHTIARALGIDQKIVWKIIHLGDDGLCHRCKAEPVHIKKYALGKRCYLKQWRARRAEA